MLLENMHNFTKSPTPLYKNFFNVSFALIRGTFGDDILRISFTKILTSIIAISNLYYVCKANAASNITR